MEEVKKDGSGDHPRICGEHRGRTGPMSNIRGSSPHMRGTRGRLVMASGCRGIIPAYAGNTSSRRRGNNIRWDHPRICGEHPRRWVARRLRLGSSPHMRGTLSFACFVVGGMGIIPAYAGNTPATGTKALPCRDHPRICGEHIEPASLGKNAGGSSPHMRGTLCPNSRVLCSTRIIPAYAGNTFDGY